MARVFGVFLVLFCLGSLPAARPDGEAERPNVVLIVWNDSDASKLGFLGEGDTRTPALDGLARSGAVFPDGIVPVQRGRPALAALLSGLYPHQNGLYYQVGPKREELADGLPELLRAAGYATFAGGRSKDVGAGAQGFEHKCEDPFGAGAVEVTRFVEEFGGKQPLFLCLAPDVSRGGPPAEPSQTALADLLGLFEARGLLANTLFAFVTDGLPPEEFSSEQCRERSLRSPLFLTLPARIPAGKRDELVTLLDLYPTLLDYAGVALPGGRAGRSLRPLLEGAAALEPRPICAAFYEARVSQGSKGGREPAKDLLALTVRDGRWKYALFLEDVGVAIDHASETVHVEHSAGDQALFDLESDPGEEHDLYADLEQAARLSELRSAVLDWWSASGGSAFNVPYTSPPLGPPPKEPRPNIVLVISDDQDYEHLGFLGNPRVHTPTLDALARAGVVFPVAHVPMSRCRPSQAALLTGLWPHQTHVYDNDAAHVLARRDSLPNLLKAAGYATFQGGKMWEGSSQSMGFLAPAATETVFLNFARQGQAELFAFVERFAKERPFFVWWAPTLPHVPHDPPERYRQLFRETEVPVPPGIVGDPEAFREAERTSFAMEAWFDDELGALRAKLEAAGELEDTLFVFLIDNGWANGFPSKGTAFEKGLRTPVFFSWPKGFSGERTNPRLVSSVDVPATILDFAGVAAPQGAQGVSLRPLLEGRELAPRAALCGALYRYKDRPGPSQPEKDVFALYTRTERWKFVLYLKNVQDPGIYHFQNEFAPFPARTRGDRDLFDLEADPYERNDLSGDSSQAQRMDELQAQCLDWWKATGGGELDLP